MALDAVRVLELDEHRPQPAGATMHIERLAGLAQRTRQRLTAHLELHRLKEDFPLLPIRAARALEQLTCRVEVAAKLVQPGLLEHHERARLGRRLGVRTLEQRVRSLELPVRQLGARAAEPHLPAQVGRAVGHRAHVRGTRALQVPVAFLELRALKPKLPHEVLGDVLDAPVDEGARGAQQLLWS